MKHDLVWAVFFMVLLLAAATTGWVVAPYVAGFEPELTDTMQLFGV